MKRTIFPILLGISIVLAVFTLAAIVYFRPEVKEKIPIAKRVETVEPQPAAIQEEPKPVVIPIAEPEIVVEPVKKEEPAVVMTPVVEESVKVEPSLIPEIVAEPEEVVPERVPEPVVTVPKPTFNREDIGLLQTMIPLPRLSLSYYKSFFTREEIIAEVLPEEEAAEVVTEVPETVEVEQVAEVVALTINDIVQPPMPSVKISDLKPKKVLPAEPPAEVETSMSEKFEVVAKPFSELLSVLPEAVKRAPIKVEAEPIIAEEEETVAFEEGILSPLWTAPTKWAEDEKPVYIDPITYNEIMWARRRDAVDQILDNVIFE